MAGIHSALSFVSASRRWLPFGVQYFPGPVDTTTIGSTKRSSCLMTSWSRLTWGFERSRW